LIRPFLWLLFATGIARQIRSSRRKVSSKWHADATIENADVIARDLPYYDPAISEAAVDGLNRFAQASGLARRSVPYNQVVALEFRHLWTA